MKSVLIITLFFGSVFCQAYPSVGDTATYTGLFQGPTGLSPVKLVVTLTSFNPVTRVFVKVSETTAPGYSPDIQTEKIHESELMTSEKAQQIIKSCPNKDYERIVVPAGRFQTCRFEGRKSSSTRLGDVPFGMVTFYAPTEKLELRSFTLGQ